MSTANTEELKLYKNTYLYNGSRYQYLLHGNNAYQTFEQWLGTAPYNKPVYYKSISEPITIREYIDDCDEYTYGSITHHSKTYYFFVDGIFTDSYGVTTINYTIDWWTTNWFSINCTKAHLTRKPTKPQYMAQPHVPLSLTASQQALTDKYTIFATYIPSTTGVEQYEAQDQTKINELVQTDSYISYILLEGTTENLQKVAQGTWYQELRLAGSDIKDCFIVPFFELNDFLDDEQTPIFTINVESDTDRWEAGTIPQRHPGMLLQAWIDKYPCYNGTSADSIYFDENAYTGNEVIYNEWSGKYYHPVWSTYTSYAGTVYHIWKLIEMDTSPVEGHQALRYWLY